MGLGGGDGWLEGIGGWHWWWFRGGGGGVIALGGGRVFERGMKLV